MIFIVLGLLLIVLMVLIRFIRKEGDWEEYRPFSECYGFTDWYNRNKNTWERERFDYLVSFFISVVTTVIMQLFYSKWFIIRLVAIVTRIGTTTDLPKKWQKSIKEICQWCRPLWVTTMNLSSYSNFM